jgi:ubiquitin-conjugating enzyme E2 J2
MGERERGPSVAPPQQPPQPLYVLSPAIPAVAPVSSSDKATVDDAAAWTTSLGKVLWEKWRWGLLIALAVMVSRFSSAT